MGQRRGEREGGRFSPAAVSHPFLLQIVYPSRGGPSTRRILYYRLEYLTRQGDTSPPRDRKRSFSSFLFHPPSASWGVQPPPLILFDFPRRREREFSRSLSLLFRWARNLSRYGLLSIYASPALHHALAGVNIVEPPSVLVNRRYPWIIHPRGVPF